MPKFLLLSESGVPLVEAEAPTKLDASLWGLRNLRGFTGKTEEMSQRAENKDNARLRESFENMGLSRQAAEIAAAAAAERIGDVTGSATKAGSLKETFEKAGLSERAAEFAAGRLGEGPQQTVRTVQVPHQQPDSRFMQEVSRRPLRESELVELRESVGSAVLGKVVKVY